MLAALVDSGTLEVLRAAQVVGAVLQRLRDALQGVLLRADDLGRFPRRASAGVDLLGAMNVSGNPDAAAAPSPAGRRAARR